MFGRRRAKRAAAFQAVPPETDYPVCGQVYLFNREAERAARDAAERESPVGDAEVQPPD